MFDEHLFHQCPAADAADRALLAAEVLDEALVALDPGRDDRGLPPLDMRGLVQRLSPRQREVLVLVAEGRSIRTIAETLFVSPTTAKTHISSLLTKLDADTRVQLATIAAKHGVR